MIGKDLTVMLFMPREHKSLDILWTPASLSLEKLIFADRPSKSFQLDFNFFFCSFRCSQVTPIDRALLPSRRSRMCRRSGVRSSIRTDRFMRLEATRRRSESANIHNCLRSGLLNWNKSVCMICNHIVIDPTERNTPRIKRQYYSREPSTTRDRSTAWRGHRKET